MSGKGERGRAPSLLGRSKDPIIGSCNAHLAEIRGYINELPGVAESALVGTRILARWALRWSRWQTRRDAGSPTGIVATLKSKLANFKIPAVSSCRSCRANTMGKVQKTCCANSIGAVRRLARRWGRRWQVGTSRALIR